MPIFSALAAVLGSTLAATAGTAAAGAGAATAASAAIGGTAAAVSGAGAAVGGAVGVGAAGTSLATGLGAVVGLGGLGLQAMGMMQQSDAAKKQADAAQMAENTRADQMNLQTTRQTRQAIRQGLMARSVALTNATAQGAGQGSGLQGGFGQVSGSTGNNITGIQNAQGMGQSMFNINKGIADAQTDYNTGQGLSSLGGALFGSADKIGKLGAYAFG